MGQVNLSLSDDTKQCLQELQGYLHCSGLSDTVTQLAWDAKRRMEAESAKTKSVMDAFTVMKLMALRDEMVHEFAVAFQYDYIYSEHEFQTLAKKGMISEHADQHAFIYGYMKNNAYRDAVILKTNLPMCSRWADGEPDYWRVDDLLGISQTEIIIRPVFANTRVNKLGESMPPETGLSEITAIGFEIVQSGGGCIKCVWNRMKAAFDVKIS